MLQLHDSYSRNRLLAALNIDDTWEMRVYHGPSRVHGFSPPPAHPNRFRSSGPFLAPFQQDRQFGCAPDLPFLPRSEPKLRGMGVHDFQEICASCHEADIVGKSGRRRVGTALPLISVPGLDIATLAARGIGIGGWPADAGGGARRPDEDDSRERAGYGRGAGRPWRPIPRGPGGRERRRARRRR